MNIAIRLNPKDGSRHNRFCLVVDRDASTAEIDAQLARYAREQASWKWVQRLGFGLSEDEIYYACRSIHYTDEPPTYPS